MSEKQSDRNTLSALEVKDSACLSLWLNDGSLAPEWSDAAGNSLLHYAASWGQGPFAELLLEKGAFASTVNALGETPEDTARVFGWDALAEKLQARAAAERQASPPVFSFQALAEIRQIFQETGENPLEDIIRQRQFGQVVELALKDAGGLSSGDLLAPCRDGESLLLKLCRTGQLHELLRPELWLKKQGEFQALWAEVPDRFRAQVDYDGFAEQMFRTRFQGRQRPRLDKGP